MRRLDWEGCFNVRDLGGLPTAGGGETRRGAVVRGDAPDGLTSAGWEALWGYGIRTIVDLRNDDERGPDLARRPDGIDTVHVPLDGAEDTTFWKEWADGPQFGTPLPYRAHLDGFPERNADALRAIAGARPGGVLVHCVGGRDRTGQIAMLALALVGVPRDAIAADYARSGAALTARYAARGEEDQGPQIAAYLAARGITGEQAILETLADLDVGACLRGGGLDDAAIAALRDRLLR